MKKLIESTKRLQGDIDKCISNLIHARQYHDKIEEAGAVLDMERLLVSSAQQLQCCIDKLEDFGSVVDWQMGEPDEPGTYLVTTEDDIVTCDYFSCIEMEWHHWPGEIVGWCNLKNIKPYKEKEE